MSNNVPLKGYARLVKNKLLHEQESDGLKAQPELLNAQMPRSNIRYKLIDFGGAEMPYLLLLFLLKYF